MVLIGRQSLKASIEKSLYDMSPAKSKMELFVSLPNG